MLTLWNNGRKGNNYNFIDRHIGNHMRMSGTMVLIHKYMGVPDPESGVASLTKIEDVTFLENRNRLYEPDVYHMIGCYNVQDIDFDLRSFGIFLANDTIFIEFHINTMLDLLGRKIIPGDVFELPHLRDDMQLDQQSRAVNRFYVVQDASKGSGGYSATWHPHIWRVKCAPMTGAQEYADILDRQATDPFGFSQGTSLRDIISTETVEAGINAEVVALAEAAVAKRYFETRQFYYVPGADTANPWVFCGDGVPPNGAVLLGSGDVFPDNAQNGDYFLRIDYKPTVLYQLETGVWRRREYDHRGSQWSAANNVLEDFWNNANETTLDNGTFIEERVALSKVLKYRPEADF